ncbi:DUF4426 domain-containing protein [Aliidiomarina maris]|uniref:DUF4426 domain-containing protein n=1 Tax=Aliidiomarina maris TaxID=531312 RepID=A0A327WU68_9GAMM|nr:DUF4426 domain-containing protein [Aliidiomarina maris]MBA3987818.1 DUF4426 domain-containing protein [Idiomarina sp.]MCL5051234.1 DUF4426 domain-containing protein [Bacillota bacterium]RAJ95231.1 uncharacterized protein DUF4426 [Aliidiomarina maris]RUO21071.1 DUF4426 domain-containing protein [Aliidiomarina maris]
MNATNNLLLKLVIALGVWLPSLLMTSALANDDGQTFERLGNWEVHYSAFPSTFVLPEVAGLYNITRSNARGIINISVLDATSDERPALRVNVSGYALNELGQRRDLTFRRHVDGEAIYYITQVPHGREETLRFFIDVRDGTDAQQLRFQHTFYRD